MPEINQQKSQTGGKKSITDNTNRDNPKSKVSEKTISNSEKENLKVQTIDQ